MTVKASFTISSSCYISFLVSGMKTSTFYHENNPLVTAQSDLRSVLESIAHSLVTEKFVKNSSFAHLRIGNCC